MALAGVRQLREDGRPALSTGRFPSALHTLPDALGLAAVPGARRVLGERELDPGRVATNLIRGRRDWPLRREFRLLH